MISSVLSGHAPHVAVGYTDKILLSQLVDSLPLTSLNRFVQRYEPYCYAKLPSCVQHYWVIALALPLVVPAKASGRNPVFSAQPAEKGGATSWWPFRVTLMLEKPELSLVLVVDDSASVSEFLVERVTGLTGARCLVASSMAQARTILASSADEPDVAVLDWILPDAPNGEIVEEVLGFGVPAIVLSGVDAADMRDRVLAAGASDYVNKDSYGIDYVARQIRRMLMAKENRILVVDDSRAYRQRIGELLKQHGYSVLYAQDGSRKSACS